MLRRREKEKPILKQQRLARRFTFVLLGFLLFVSPFLILTVQALPAAILRVSLPAGTVVGPDPDPWLSEGWLLNLEGETQTFVVRIEDVSASQRSYDTHLVIALNDAGYNNLVSLYVDTTTIPKSAFRYGTPTPYNLWSWPSGDVYPTWFNDTLVNVGTIRRKGFQEVTVSVTFSSVTDVGIHFDAWGKRVSGSPESSGDITHNPLSADSTVLFEPGQPQPQPPYAEFSFTPAFPEVSEIVTFDASSSYDPDGYIASYTWDFGDGIPPVTETDSITTYSYTALGDYEVTLTVTDNDGLNGTVSDIVHVCEPPVASFVFSPIDPLEHEEVTFDASSSTPDGGTITSYKWDFGDGNITTLPGPIITHTYATYGNYIITLNVTDSEGKWDMESKPITVERLPVSDFAWSPLYPEVYEIVTLDASYSTPDGGVLISYEWNFGDGTPNVIETDPLTTHHYTTPGNYTITLNVTDSEDRWDIESKIITVNPSPSPEAILHLSIPTGTYVYDNPDPWLDECWLLNKTGLSGTFILKIEEVSGSTTSYDTHLIVALNNEAYNNLVSLTINTTTIPKTAFRNGTPTPFNLWSWPSGDVYPTWFNDTLINLGTISPKEYVTVTVSVTFSNATGVRMHFDAYGSKVSPAPPAVPGQITRNPLSADSTVWFWQPPVVKYYLTVITPYGTPGGEGWYDNGTNAYATLNTNLVDHGNGTRRVFTHWSGDASGTNYAQSDPIHMDGNKTAIAQWKTRFLLTIKTRGIPSAYPTKVYLDGLQVGTASDALQYTKWFDSGTSTGTIGVDDTVSGAMGTRYVFVKWVEDSSTSNPRAAEMMNSPKTFTALYKTQYYLTVNTSPAGLNPAPIPPSNWYDNSTDVELTAPSESYLGSDKYDFTHWKVDGTQVSDNPITVHMDAPHRATAYYTPTGPPAVPVGGRSISLTKQAPTSYIAAYATLIALFGAALGLTKRKRK